jgi:hypothetical protein
LATWKFVDGVVADKDNFMPMSNLVDGTTDEFHWRECQMRFRPENWIKERKKSRPEFYEAPGFQLAIREHCQPCCDDCVKIWDQRWYSFCKGDDPDLLKFLERTRSRQRYQNGVLTETIRYHLFGGDLGDPHGPIVVDQ